MSQTVFDARINRISNGKGLRPRDVGQSAVHANGSRPFNRWKVAVLGVAFGTLAGLQLKSVVTVAALIAVPYDVHWQAINGDPSVAAAFVGLALAPVLLMFGLLLSRRWRNPLQFGCAYIIGLGAVTVGDVIPFFSANPT